jgi:hypothetical protein
MKKLLVAMLLLFPLSALGETYQWTDDRGTVNFAEDLGRVPKKYRKKAKPLGDAGVVAPQSSAPQSADKGAEPAPKVQGKREGELKEKQLFGGKDEVAWRREFLAARHSVKLAESDLADLQLRLSDTSKMSRTEYLSIQSGVKQLEVRVQQQQKRFDQLREQADKLMVPQEWRQ